MYEVSQAYKEALLKPFKQRRLTGHIGITAFTEENITAGAFKIYNQISDGVDIKLGSVYIGTLEATFWGVDLVGQWANKVITVSEGLKLANGEYEDVPLGVYTVSEANHASDGVHVTAYDNMMKLDVPFPALATGGYAWDYLMLIQQASGVQMGQTEAEIRALPNGQKGYTLAAENDIETCRDMLHWIAQTLGCFATCNREGKIVLRQYGSEVVDTISSSVRWRGSSFSDFTTYYTAVSLGLNDGTSLYYPAEIDNGLTYELGINPLMQDYAEPPQIMAMGQILHAIESIRYTPFSMDRAGCPAYDLGDKIEFTDTPVGTAYGCVMSYDYTFHGQYTIEGYGSNPALANAKSKADKEIGAMMRNSAIANQIQFYNYTNAKKLVIEDDWTQIMYIRFGSMTTTIVTFHAEIKLTAEVTRQGVDKIIGQIKYIFNDSEVEYKPVETWFEGTHLLHILYYFPIQSAQVNRLSVRMKCDGRITIERADIQACLWGQGLAASSNWDGWIECEDYQPEIALSTAGFAVDPMGDALEVKIRENIRLSFDENIGSVALDTLPAVSQSIREELYVNKQRMSAVLWADLLEYTWGDVENNFLW